MNTVCVDMCMCWMGGCVDVTLANDSKESIQWGPVLNQNRFSILIPNIVCMCVCVCMCERVCFTYQGCKCVCQNFFVRVVCVCVCVCVCMCTHLFYASVFASTRISLLCYLCEYTTQRTQLFYTHTHT